MSLLRSKVFFRVVAIGLVYLFGPPLTIATYPQLQPINNKMYNVDMEHHTPIFPPIYFSDEVLFNGAVYTTKHGDDIAITRKSTPEEILIWATIVSLDRDIKSTPHNINKKIITELRKLQSHHLKINSVIKIMATELNKELNDLVVKKRGIDRDSVHNAFLESLIEEKLELKKMLEALSIIKKVTDSNFITENDIIKAKEYPMDRLLSFDQASKAECIFHDGDKTPSLHWYKKTNTVYCFGCNKKADTIAVYMHQHNVDFINAVKKLII